MEINAGGRDERPEADIAPYYDVITMQGSETKDGKLAVGNNYVEGCWHLLRNSTEKLPGMVLGTASVSNQKKPLPCRPELERVVKENGMARFISVPSV